MFIMVTLLEEGNVYDLAPVSFVLLVESAILLPLLRQRSICVIIADGPPGEVTEARASQFITQSSHGQRRYIFVLLGTSLESASSSPPIQTLQLSVRERCFQFSLLQKPSILTVR